MTVHAQKPDFVFRRNGPVHLNRQGASVQSTTGSRAVRISGSNAGYTMFRGSVKGTGYPLHSPFSPSLPLPCITVCHHISAGLYYKFESPLEASWNVMVYSQKPDFVFRRNVRVHLNRRGPQFSRLLADEVCASAVVMLDTPCFEVVWRVLATHSIRQFPLHFPPRASPCAITFQLESTFYIRHNTKNIEQTVHVPQPLKRWANGTVISAAIIPTVTFPFPSPFVRCCLMEYPHTFGARSHD